MCMLTFFPENIQPDEQALLNGATQNDDGQGYAIVVPAYGSAKARMIVNHGMDAHEMVTAFMRDRERYPHGPALFHSRWSTGGLISEYNCHPFYMNNDMRTVVAHNGVLPQHMQPHKGDIRCDTRLAADELFHDAYGHLSYPGSRLRLANAIGAGNKLVILTIDPEYGTHSIIINEGSGIWEDDGMWYSNHDYIGHSYPTTYTMGNLQRVMSIYGWDGDDSSDDMSAWFAGTTTPNKLDDDCPLCKAIGSVDIPSAVCEMCKSCLDCFEDLDDCLCYWSYKGDTKYTDEDDEAEKIDYLPIILGSGDGS